MKATKWAVAGLLMFVGASAAASAEQVRLAEGTPVRLRLKADLTSDNAKEGMRVDFEVMLPVVVNDLTVIPEDALAWGAVQDFKKHKFVEFDIEALRLPSLQQIRLRSVREKPKKSDQDVIRIETPLGGDVGAMKGTSFTGYLDHDVDVEVTPPTQPTPPPNPGARAVKLAPRYVTVQFFSDPMGADILIDGEYVGNTPSILKVSPAKHRLELQMAGYSSQEQMLDLTSSHQVRTIQVTLDKVQ